MKAKISNLLKIIQDSTFKIFTLLTLILIMFYLFSGITFIESNEVALVLHFGKLSGNSQLEQIHQPGLLLTFPEPVDQIVRVPVKVIQEITIDDLYSKDKIASILNSGYAITGNQGLVEAFAHLKYQIKNPVQYALQMDNPDNIIKRIVTSTLLKEIAGLEINIVLTEGKKKLATAVIQKAQNKIDKIKLGVLLLALEFDQLQPPDTVKAAFDQVTNAYIEKETLVKEAQRQREEKIQNALAEKQTLISQAETNRSQWIAQARSDLAQFNGLQNEYTNNPDSISKRIYLEKKQQIISRISKQLIIDQKFSSKIILP